MSVFMMCEQALGLLNASDMRDLDDDHRVMLEALSFTDLVNTHAQREAVVCARHFASVRDRLLQLEPWVFARKEATPAQLVSPVEGWRFAYTLPVDCLRVLVLTDGPHHRDHEDHHHFHGRYHRSAGVMTLQHWEQLGRVICCNHKGIHIRYTAKIEDTAVWDPCYTEAFCAGLAMEIAPSVCANSVIAGSMAQAMNVLLQAAIVQGHRAGVIADANELRDQQPLWMDYSGIPTGFDDIGRWGY